MEVGGFYTISLILFPFNVPCLTPSSFPIYHITIYVVSHHYICSIHISLLPFPTIQYLPLSYLPPLPFSLCHHPSLSTNLLLPLSTDLLLPCLPTSSFLVYPPPPSLSTHLILPCLHTSFFPIYRYVSAQQYSI